MREEDFPAIQPIMQKRIWDRFEPGPGPEALAGVIEQLKQEDAASTWRAEAGRTTSPGSAATRTCWGRWRPPGAVRREGAAPRHVPIRPSLPQGPVPPADEPDELLPVLGRRALDRLGPGTVPSHDGHSRSIDRG